VLLTNPRGGSGPVALVAPVLDRNADLSPKVTTVAEYAGTAKNSTTSPAINFANMKKNIPLRLIKSLRNTSFVLMVVFFGRYFLFGGTSFCLDFGGWSVLFLEIFPKLSQRRPA
jgi:hypothetical protein